MNTSEVLDRAADLIEERGWSHTGGWPGEENYGGRTGSNLCLEGGIMAALGLRMNDSGTGLSDLRSCPAYEAVRAHLDWAEGVLYTWNDAKERNAAEVIEVLRACAVIEAAREEQDAAWETYAEVVVA